MERAQEDRIPHLPLGGMAVGDNVHRNITHVPPTHLGMNPGGGTDPGRNDPHEHGHRLRLHSTSKAPAPAYKAPQAP
jgi:hypothetical protein